MTTSWEHAVFLFKLILSMAKKNSKGPGGSLEKKDFDYTQISTVNLKCSFYRQGLDASKLINKRI